MATSLSKLLTRSNAHSHLCSTSATISTTSRSLQRQFWSRHFSAVADSCSRRQRSSHTPLKDNKRGSKWSKWLLFLPGAVSFGLGSWKIVRREERALSTIMQSPILVNRGWVPRIWREKSSVSSEVDFVTNESTETKPLSHEQTFWWKIWPKTPVITKEDVSTVKPVEVVGVIRGGENPSIFVPANDSSTGQWFYVDVPAMARAIGLPENTIYVEDVHENVYRSRPYPVSKDINSLIHSKVMPQESGPSQ